jgi:hypothetical protein
MMKELEAARVAFGKLLSEHYTQPPFTVRPLLPQSCKDYQPPPLTESSKRRRQVEM